MYFVFERTHRDSKTNPSSSSSKRLDWIGYPYTVPECVYVYSIYRGGFGYSNIASWHILLSNQISTAIHCEDLGKTLGKEFYKEGFVFLHILLFGMD